MCVFLKITLLHISKIKNFDFKNTGTNHTMGEELAIAWIDLTFRVRPLFMRKEKTILSAINGSVNFGTLNALMGPSGSGKTSLLKCINGRNKSGIGEESKIFLNSREKIRSCFIGQHEKEHLIMGLTAKQNLIYASKLTNSENQLKIDHESNAMNLLSELMASDIADTKVEDCSGGEQKRLSIALQMTQRIKPNLLCIDEPTTGLDSNAAEVVKFKSIKFIFLSSIYIEKLNQCSGNRLHKTVVTKA
jgi:ABC-type multidrug transport system ATPase subunit